MANNHPLDRPVWNALRTRQKTVAIGNDKAVRMMPDYGHFAAAAGRSPECRTALSALVPANDLTWLIEIADRQPPPGTLILSHGPAVQMVGAKVRPALPEFDFVQLTEDHVIGMRALAHLAQPGPFLSCTHRLGDFIGVQEDGCLVAMAGERLKLDGFTEISAVCTRPDQRGRGFAGNLVRVLANRIIARGETPFLHAYGGNKSAIALYKKLGFSVRRRMRLTVLGRSGI